MDKLIVIFKGERSPGLYRLITDVKIEELSSLSQEYNFQVVYIDGKNVTNKAEFIKAAAEAMNFPGYFGDNWDAFNDCINDLSWLAANGYILLYTHPDNFAQNDPLEWSIALDVFQEAVEYWAGTDTPMYVLLKTDTLALDQLEVI